MAFIDRGRIAALDTPHNLKQQYGKRALRAQIALPDGQLESREIDLDEAGTAESVRALFEQEQVVTIHSEEASLEDIFVDVGLVLPTAFDRQVKAGEETTLNAYIWGESLLKNRLFLGITMAFLFRDLTGLDSPVEIATAIVGEGQVIPWEERLLPVIVLMTIILGGIMVPATSLVEEKQNRTLGALVITPASLNYVFAAKGLLGAILSFFVAIVVLVLNGAVGTQPLLLAMVLGLAASLGLLLSASMKDVDTLFAVIKATGILLYAPAIVYLFPGIPQWIGKLFPTYYLIAPVFEISQQGATWSDVALDVFILAGLIVVMLGTVAFAARRLGRQGT